MADASISLGLNASELYGELKTVDSRFTSTTRKAAANASKSFGGKISGFLGGGLQQGIAALGVGKAAKDIFDYADRVQDLSERFGVSAETLQRFGNAAEQNGSSLEGVAGAFNKLEISRSKALGGNEAAIKSYAALGITFKDLETLTPDQLMLKIGESSFNAADAVKVMGKGALEMKVLLQGLADGAIEFGTAIDNLDVARIDAAGDALKAAHDKVTVGGATILATFIQGYELFANAILTILSVVGASIESSIAAGERLVHGDFKGAKQAIASGQDRNAEILKGGRERKEEIEAGPQDKTRKRGGGGTGDDEDELDEDGNPIGKSAAKEAERNAKKVAALEEEARLAALSDAERLADMRAKAAALDKGAKGATDEAKRNELKLKYFALVKDIAAEEKAQAADAKKSETEQAKLRERAQKFNETVGTAVERGERQGRKDSQQADNIRKQARAGGTLAGAALERESDESFFTRGDDETGNEFLARTGRIDGSARRATPKSGLESGGLTTGRVQGAEGGLDGDFDARNQAWADRMNGTADTLGGANSGETSDDPNTPLLEAIKTNTESLGKNQ